MSPVCMWQCTCSKRKFEDKKCAIIVASFPGLPCSFCSLVCVDNNIWMLRSGEEWGRPGIIHHVSGVRWMQGGLRGAGPVVVTAGPEAVHYPVGSVRTFRG